MAQVIANPTLRDVARVLGKSEWVFALEIQNGLYPYAAAYSIKGRSKKNYIFNPVKFREFYGDEVYNEVYLPKKKEGADGQ